MTAIDRAEQKHFEDEVRRIARELWPGAQYSGARMIDGRERDGYFETEDCLHLLEATVSRGKVVEKIKHTKTSKNLLYLRKNCNLNFYIKLSNAGLSQNMNRQQIKERLHDSNIV